MFSEQCERWMREAIRIATERGDGPSPAPIGAVIVHVGLAISIELNRTEALCDATVHAEMMAFRSAGAERRYGAARRGAINDPPPVQDVYDGIDLVEVSRSSTAPAGTKCTACISRIAAMTRSLSWGTLIATT